MITLKQLMCLHYWKKTELLDILYGKGSLYRYECKECGRKIARWTGNEPISGLLPKDPWAEYKKDPQNNVSPPIIYSDN